MAAEDDAAGAADAQPAKQDWGADADDNALPPLSNMGWADDDEDELPPLDPTWANLPVPDSPKREKPPAAFKPRDDRGGAEPRASVFSRLGEGGGNAWRRPDAPPDRGGPPDRGPPRSRDPPAGRREDPPRGRREPENPHDWHREQMRLQEAERAARGEPHPHRSQNAPSRSPNANARPQTQQNAMPAEVVYLSRDAQRAAALKREEDAAWRLARDSLATFHATASHSTASHSASHSAAFAPSACREMLNALSEPPFAEGRLAPNARAAFAVVASASKSGATRPEEEVRAVVTGVVAPLRHLLAHGVATPGGAAAGSTGAFIAEQMHTAAVKLLVAALEVLAGGEVTRGAVEAAEGIKDVREAAAAKIAGGAPRAGQKKAGPGAGGGGGAAASSGRGDKGHKGDKGDKGDKGAPPPEKLQASKLRKPDGPSPLERDAKGPDRDRWEKKPAREPQPRAEESSASRRVSREGAREPPPPDRRRSLEEKPRPRSEARDSPSAAAVSAARPRVVPKVVIRPSRKKEDPTPRRDAAPSKAKSAKSTKDAETHTREKEKPPAPGSSPGSVFSRLEGTPSPLPAPAGDRDAQQTHKSPKPPPGKPPHASAQKLVPSPKPAAGAEKHDIPHPKPAAGSPAAGRPGRGEKKHAAPGPKDAASSKGEKKHGGAPGDEWHALDEELERAAGKAGKGRAKGDKASGGKEARVGGKAGGAEKHDIPHPKTAAPAAPAIPAPKPSPGTSPAPKPVPPKDELDTVLDEELAKAKKSRRSGGRGRGGK